MIQKQWKELKGTLLTYGSKLYDLETLHDDTKQALVMFYNHLKLQTANKLVRQLEKINNG